MVKKLKNKYNPYNSLLETLQKHLKGFFMPLCDWHNNCPVVWKNDEMKGVFLMKMGLFTG